MAAEQGLSVDEAGFRTLMGEQRQRAKADSEGAEDRVTPTFGLPRCSTAPVRRPVHRLRRGPHRGAGSAGSSTARRPMLRRRATTSRWSSTAPRSTPRAAASSPTPAVIRLSSGALVEVDDVQQPVPGLIVHRARVVSGEVAVGDEAHAEIDVERRRAICARTRPPTWCTRRSAVHWASRRPRRVR